MATAFALAAAALVEVRAFEAALFPFLPRARFFDAPGLALLVFFLGATFFLGAAFFFLAGAFFLIIFLFCLVISSKEKSSIIPDVGPWTLNAKEDIIVVESRIAWIERVDGVNQQVQIESWRLRDRPLKPRPETLELAPDFFK